MGLRLGQGSHCTGLERRRAWLTLWESLAEKGQCSSQNVDQTSLRSPWPTQSCPSHSKQCILEGPPYPAQLSKERPGMSFLHKTPSPQACRGPAAQSSRTVPMCSPGQLFFSSLRKLPRHCMQCLLSGPLWTELQSHQHFSRKAQP